jgi:hypothetical protein
MKLATEKETHRFLSAILFAWNQCVIHDICKIYELNAEQRTILETALLKPNNLQLHIKPSLSNSS